MNVQLEQIEVILGRVERLALQLCADPNGDVRRSAIQLRDAFETRRAIEPAVALMLDRIRAVRNTHDGPRREFQRRAPGLDRLEHVIAWDLLPQLRRVGFDV